MISKLIHDNFNKSMMHDRAMASGVDQSSRYCGQTDYSLCIKCKNKMKESLVQPKLPSFIKFLECVRKRSEGSGLDDSWINSQ